MITPHQIVYLEHGTTRLYAEVIDIVHTRQLCWARPLMLVVSSEALTGNWADISTLALEELYNLKDSPDIIWPLCLFQPALDIEVFQLLSNLQRKDASISQSAGIQHMQRFVHQLWAAYPEHFSHPSAS
ncbi:MAG: hypothetical protein AAF215_07160 [Cyanobacteria bacterium P01_A01_bin.123]